MLSFTANISTNTGVKSFFAVKTTYFDKFKKSKNTENQYFAIRNIALACYPLAIPLSFVNTLFIVSNL